MDGRPLATIEMKEPTTSSRRFHSEIRPMLTLALPVVVAELGWMAMGLVDTMMVGRLGTEAIGAVGLGNIVFFGVAVFGIGILLGMDTLVSQSFGAGDLEDCHRSLVQGIYLAIGVSVPLMILIAAMIPLMRISGIAPDVLRLAIPYLGVLNWGLPPLLIFFAVRRYLQGMNLVAPVLLGLLMANLANWLGNWLLVTGRWGFPALGVTGSGWATVFSRFAMLTMGLGYALWHGISRKTGLLHVSLRPDWPRLSRLIAIGLPSAAQVTLEVLVFGAAAVLAGRLGENAIAAHELVLQVAGAAFMVPLGIASAGAVRVGQAIGRGDRPGASQAGWTAMAIGAGFMGCSGLAMLWIPGTILGVFQPNATLMATARTLLVAAAIFQVFDGLQVVGSGVLRGVGETRVPMLINLLAHWGIGLPVGYALAFHAGLGVLGLWIGLATGLIVAGVLLVATWARSVGRVPVESLVSTTMAPTDP